MGILKPLYPNMKQNYYNPAIGIDYENLVAVIKYNLLYSQEFDLGRRFIYSLWVLGMRSTRCNNAI